MHDRTHRALRKAGSCAVSVAAWLLCAIVCGASAGVMLFCLGWWVLG